MIETRYIPYRKGEFLRHIYCTNKAGAVRCVVSVMCGTGN